MPGFPQGSFGMFTFRQPKRWNLVLIALLFSSLLLSGLSGAETVSAAPGTGISSGDGSPFGANVQGSTRYRPTFEDDFRIPYSPAQAAGVGWTREEFVWERIEPRPNQFKWDNYDRAIKAAQTRGLKVLIMLNHNVIRNGSGDAGGSNTMPELGAWTNFVRQVVKRYAPLGILHYQVWNEPQDPVYFASASPQDYARLISASYDAIKQTDGRAQVLTAGFVPVDNGIDWMNQFLDAGGRGHFDILAVHPYVNDPQTGSMSPERAYWTTTELNQTANFAAKVGKPVWATEFGWNTVNSPGRQNGVNFEQQANYLTRAYVQGLASSKVIEKYFVYQFTDDVNNASDRYGLLGNDWNFQKPSFGAFRTMTARLNNTSPQGRIDPYEGSGNYAKVYDFSNLNGAGFGCANGGGSGGGVAWSCFASPMAQASATPSTEQSRPGSGSQPVKINYSFRSGTNDRYVTFYPTTFQNFPLNPTRLGFWVYGDGNRTELRVLIKDSAGQVLSYDVGRMGPPSAGWQRYEAQLAYPKFPAGASIAFPVKSFEILLDGWPKNADVSGTIFVDGIYVENTPPVYMYRFNKGGGVVDVVWAADSSATVPIATSSSQATLYKRDGTSQQISASNGVLNVPAGDAPVYIEHVPGAGTTAPPGNNPVGGGGLTPIAGCSGPGNTALRSLFNPTWERYDEAITSGRAQRSWVWGPEALPSYQEPYKEAPGGCRTVLYWDKSRMEITRPGGDQSSKYFVTNGLLAKELMGGQLQVGDYDLIPASQGAARIPAAGDSVNNPGTPTYATFARVSSLPNKEVFAASREGQLVSETIDAAGNTGTNPGLNSYGVRLTNFVPETKHNTADVFWRFMNSRGPVKNNGVFAEGDAVDWLYSIGFPVSEAYWAKVTVGGQVKDVLIQAFERRVLTFTPSNPAAYQVEMGNIGRHYLAWRYGWTG